VRRVEWVRWDLQDPWALQEPQAPWGLRAHQVRKVQSARQE
jgi:hypothetical protein